MVVAVLGASPNSHRYSNQAVRLLLEYGHDVIPVNPGHDEIEGLKAVPSLKDVEQDVDTLTVYVGVSHISALIPDILELKPKRVILNPGTESSELIQALKKADIPYRQDCTLIMLDSGRF